MIVKNTHELKVAMTGSTYHYWEVFRYANDGDVFEIVESPIEGFEGKRVVMKKHKDSGIVMKVVGTYHDDDAKSLVTPYGAITGAMFKRVDVYKRIKASEAIAALEENRQVYYKDALDQFEEVRKWDDFSDDLGLYDFHDVLKFEFYIKGSL